MFDFSRRGQVTIFIVVGIVILMAVGLMLLFIKSSSVSTKSQTSDEASVSSYIEACLEHSSKLALLSVASKGGYDYLPDVRYSGDGFQASYAYLEGVVWLRPLMLMEDAIADETLRLLPSCFDGFSSFAQTGIDVIAGEPAASVTVGKDAVTIQLEQVFEVTKDGSTTTVDSIKHSIPSRFLDMRSVAEQLIFSTVSDPRFIDQQFMLELAIEEDLQIDAIYTDFGDVIYVIQDTENLIDDHPQVFMFATKSFLGEEPPTLFMTETTFVGVVGEELVIYVLAVDANDDFLTYGSSDAVIRPDANGVISFTPDEIGETLVELTVSDGLFIVRKEITVIVEEAS